MIDRTRSVSADEAQSRNPRFAREDRRERELPGAPDSSARADRAARRAPMSDIARPTGRADARRRCIALPSNSGRNAEGWTWSGELAAAADPWRAAPAKETP